MFWMGSQGEVAVLSRIRWENREHRGSSLVSALKRFWHVCCSLGNFTRLTFSDMEVVQNA